jgi:hypothetical protein
MPSAGARYCPCNGIFSSVSLGSRLAKPNQQSAAMR